MSDSHPQYIPNIIKECNEMLHLLNDNDCTIISDEKKANIIMQINSSKEYLMLLWEQQNHDS